MPVPDFVDEPFIYRIAPDGKVVQAARELANSSKYRDLDLSAEGTWMQALCQGSDLYPYMVSVDLSNASELITSCDCMSFKRPCKHALGLLWLAHQAPDRFESVEHPSPGNLRIHRDETHRVRPRQDAASIQEPEDLDAAFLQDILAHSEDEAPRLIYADWLMENGEPEQQARGEFIQLQCQLSRMDARTPLVEELRQREHALWLKYRSQWMRNIPRQLHRKNMTFDRGFLEFLQAKGSFFRKHAGEVLRHHPLTRYRVSSLLNDNEAGKFAVCPHLAPIRVLLLDKGGIGHPRNLNMLLATPYLSRLTHLDISRAYLSSRGIKSLVEMPRLEQLTKLGLGHNDIGDAGAQSLASCPRFMQLRELNLSQNSFGNSGAQAFLDSPWMENLESLDLTRNNIGVGVRGALRERFGSRVRLE